MENGNGFKVTVGLRSIIELLIIVASVCTTYGILTSKMDQLQQSNMALQRTVESVLNRVQRLEICLASGRTNCREYLGDR